MTSAKTEVFTSSDPPRCRVDTSLQNYWIASLTFYTTQETHSSNVPSFPSRGSRALASAFSPRSNFQPWRACNHGQPRFQIPPPPPPVTPGFYSLGAPWRLWLRMQKSGAGFKLSLALKFWTSVQISRIAAHRQYLFSRSTDSPPTLKLSAWLFVSFHPHRFSASSPPSLFWMTSAWSLGGLRATRIPTIRRLLSSP